MSNIYLESGFLVLAYMTIWFLICQWRKDISLVDVAWGLGFVVLAGWSYFKYQQPDNLLFFLMVAIWGLRLAIYLLIRN